MSNGARNHDDMEVEVHQGPAAHRRLQLEQTLYLLSMAERDAQSRGARLDEEERQLYEDARKEILDPERVKMIRQRKERVQQRWDALSQQPKGAVRVLELRGAILDGENLHENTSLVMQILAGLPRGALFDISVTGALRLHVTLLNETHYAALVYEHRLERDDSLLAAVMVRRDALSTLIQSTV